MAKNSEFILTLEELSNSKQEYYETIFALSNGHFGIRAAHPLKTKTNYPGNPGLFVNGFYESEPISYGEWAYGYAKNHETICKLPNIRGLNIVIGEEASTAGNWQVEKLRAELDMYQGILTEVYSFKTSKDKKFTLEMQSFASMVETDIYACSYRLLEKDFSETIELIRVFEESRGDVSENNDPRTAQKSNQYQITQVDSTYKVQTHKSNLNLFVEFLGATNYQLKDENQLVTTLTRVSKIFENYELELDFSVLLRAQKTYYQIFWENSDVVIGGNSELQKGIRFNLFHLNQNAGRDGKTNFAAKGLTGEGYEGHYFWDTEMYLLPFFIYTQPETAKQLLRYRLNILPQAKQRAEELSQKGALFAWRTISGQETSAYYPAGSAQVHINGDIVYGFQLYENVTGDTEFIKESQDVIFDTARFWLNFGDYINKAEGEFFCINGVTGPDEYSALVNNNFYTNKMAANNLSYAAELARRFDLHEEEALLWQEASDRMYFGFNQELAVTQQDDDFLQQKIWGFEATPSECYPLLLHYHPMIIYKHQVCKQADTVLAAMLFPEDFEITQMQVDYDYYEKVTTHDSSLSCSIFSVVASRLSMTKKGYEYFMDTALMDLNDIQGNVIDGIHAANMGGSWLSLIYGFAGLRYENGLVLESHLPKELSELKFSLRFLGEIIKINLVENEISCIFEENTKLAIKRTGSKLQIYQQ